MGFNIEVGVSAITVFLQGIISFFSPCVLPLVPLYIGYLSGGAKTVDENGLIRYRRGKVMLNTLFFVLGVSFAFFLLGFGFTAAGQFFKQYQSLFTRIGGILIILFGLYQLGVFGASKLIATEHRLPFRLDKFAMSPVVALVLGFTFSFAWTPCVGPALASVLLMASSAASAAKGFALIGLYTLGFVLPFLAVGLFTGSLLDFFKKHQKVVKYTVKVGGALMILMGVMMFTGWMNGFSTYLSRFGVSAPPAAASQTVSPTPSAAPEPTDTPEAAVTPRPAPVGGGAPAPAETTPAAVPSAPAETAPAPTATPDPNAIPAPDFTLKDQNGDEHTLSDYQGKVVFLNFWATWCPPCQREMPDVQALYEDWDKNEGDVVVLGVANPKSAEYPYNQDEDEESIKTFLSDRDYTYPVVMDTTGDVFAAYGISAFPTTFMIDKEGNVFGYVQGGISRDIMDSIVDQTISGVRQ